MFDDHYDVVISGYGPVGAAAANLCGRAGLKTLVLERGAAPYDLPRAIHFDAEAMRIFQSVGLADQVAGISRPLGGSVYLGVDGRRIRTFRGPDMRGTLGWPASNLFYQPHLEAVLRKGVERFEHVHVRPEREVLTVEALASGAEVRWREPDGGAQAARGRFLLACDGASSPVRKALGIALDDLRFEERWLVIDAFVDGPMRWPEDREIPDEVRDGRFSLMVCDPRRPATLIPGEGRHRRWEYMLLDGEADAEMQAPEAIARLLSEWVDPANVQVVRSAVYRFHGLVAKRWRDGPVFLLGDAAHQTPPFFGQGMCHGLRDAAQLVWKLKLVLDGVADDALLDSYEAERDEHVRSIIRASIEAGSAVCILNPERAQDRDAQFRATEAARAGATVAMTDVVPPIRGGVIGASGGERLPQPPVRERGRDVRLDDRLEGRFALLTFDADTALPGAALPGWRALDGHVLRLGRRGDGATAGALIDTTGALQAWFEDRGAAWVLVRPDRYVFGTAGSTDGVLGLVNALAATVHVKHDQRGSAALAEEAAE